MCLSFYGPNKMSTEEQSVNCHDGGREDVGDALGIPFFNRTSEASAYLSIHPDSEEYNMRHKTRGKCLIFNNKDFDPHTRLNERRGTNQDGEQLYRCFRELDFEVVMHCNLPVKAMLNELEKVSKEDHSNRDCFVCCILTHGEQGALYGRDGKFPNEMVFTPFTGDLCTSLAGKPKIFFIQACQGDKLDRGVTLATGKDEPDAGSKFFKIPTHADFLICYSTVPGFYSWRNTNNGSWFVQALCKVLEGHAKDMDLQSLMTIVCRKVAYDFESCVPNDPGMDRMKQVPCISSMLTRKIYFHPKI
ncbi:caspase drICE-like isoform X2 [Tachypleus tridentatus]|uniref:caspase drICE-like isoform X2 n=1 Tax=Tachypleus tridentatus TaxID=6853 RepID=UPI003FD2660B